MRFELKRLQREMGITAVYVTHDQVEALAMSNRIAVMNSGQIQQVGRPREIYDKPASRFVAGFIGKTNFMDGTVERKEPDGVYAVSTANGALRTTSGADLPVGAAVVASIRPEHIGLQRADEAADEPNSWTGTVETRAFLGESVDHLVSLGKSTLQVRSPARVSIPPGTEVVLTFPPEQCLVIPADE